MRQIPNTRHAQPSPAENPTPEPQDSRQTAGLGQIISNSLTRKGLLAAIAVAAISLTAGYILGRLWLQAPVIFLLGVLWGVFVLREIRWTASLMLVLMLAAAAVGYMANLSHFLMLAAGCASAVAWDLHQLEGRILDLDEPATKEMEKRHLLRAFMVFGISFLVIAADSLLRIRVRFIILIVLTVLMILVLNQVMLLVRNIGKPRAPKETVYRSTIGQNIFSDPESWSFTERDRQLASSEKPPDKQ